MASTNTRTISVTTSSVVAEGDARLLEGVLWVWSGRRELFPDCRRENKTSNVRAMCACVRVCNVCVSVCVYYTVSVDVQVECMDFRHGLCTYIS